MYRKEGETPKRTQEAVASIKPSYFLRPSCIPPILHSAVLHTHQHSFTYTLTRSVLTLEALRRGCTRR
jgi:hypothetical protein